MKTLFKFSVGVRNIKRNKKGKIIEADLEEISLVDKHNPTIVDLDKLNKKKK